MFITYTAADSGEAQQWEFLPGRIKASRQSLLQKHMRKLAGERIPFAQFRLGVMQGDADSIRVMLWHLLSLEHPTLRLEDVDPEADEIKVDYSKDELIQLRAEVAKAPIPEDQREAILAKFDEDIEAAEDSEGKAPTASTKSESDTA